MTEDEWLTSDEPKPMLQSVHNTLGPRKMRLFGCALCRLAGHLLRGRSGL